MKSWDASVSQWDDCNWWYAQATPTAVLMCAQCCNGGTYSRLIWHLGSHREKVGKVLMTVFFSFLLSNTFPEVWNLSVCEVQDSPLLFSSLLVFSLSKGFQARRVISTKSFKASWDGLEGTSVGFRVEPLWSRKSKELFYDSFSGATFFFSFLFIIHFSFDL